MKKTLQDRIAALAAMNLPALSQEHREVCSTGSPVERRLSRSVIRSAWVASIQLA
jgi:hypothetical protein